MSKCWPICLPWLGKVIKLGANSFRDLIEGLNLALGLVTSMQVMVAGMYVGQQAVK